MIPRMALPVATALLGPHRRVHPVVAEARRAQRWLELTSLTINLTARIEANLYSDKFCRLMDITYGVDGCGPIQSEETRGGNPKDARALRRQLSKHSRRLEVLGSMWLSAQPKPRRKK